MRLIYRVQPRIHYTDIGRETQQGENQKHIVQRQLLPPRAKENAAASYKRCK